MPDVRPTRPKQWVVQVERIGTEGHPILVIDNAVPEPDALAQRAATLDFKPLAPSYPGLRAPPPNSYLQAIMPSLLGLLRDVYGYRHGAHLQECFFSLVTTRPQDLTPMQRLPHFDGLGDEKVALLHYLCGAEKGGTHFFRHRATGYESVTGARFPGYKRALEREIEAVGLPPPAYPTRSGDLFERITTQPACYNRMIVYRGISLHSIGLPDDFAFEADPVHGRLTVNTFLKPAPPA